MKQEIIRIDLNGVNCYLGKQGDNFILFDTGGALIMDKQLTSRREKLDNELEKAGCKPGNLKLIVLTHGDCDHSANAAYIRDKYNTVIAMHPGDLELVENPDLERVMQNFHFKSPVYGITIFFMKKLIKRMFLKVIDNFEKFKPDIFVDEGFSLSDYGFEAKVIHIPGHTPGSIGILTSEGNLIAGDIFSNIKKPGIAINAYQFKIMKVSVKRIRTLEIGTVFPGHGEPFAAKQL